MKQVRSEHMNLGFGLCGFPEESDLIAEDVAHKLFDLGYNNFDIEVSV